MKKFGRQKKLRAAALALAVSLLCPEAAWAAGWENTGNGWRYQKEDGSYLADGLSPDGYYIDGSGLWTENTVILGLKLPNRNSFLRASQLGSMTGLESDLRVLVKAVTSDCGNVRGAGMEDRGITWFLNGDTEQELFAFYKDTSSDGYTLKVSCSFSRARGTKPRGSWYDYQVLTALLCRVSATGPQIAEAVWSSWQDENAYGIKPGGWVRVGDAEVSYESTSGAGIYRIRPAGAS